MIFLTRIKNSLFYLEIPSSEGNNMQLSLLLVRIIVIVFRKKNRRDFDCLFHSVLKVLSAENLS